MIRQERQTQRKQHRVLLISYLFPPIGGGGVQRALKMARYLPQFGWLPTVLTVQENITHATIDRSLLEQLPGDVKIIRAGQPDVRHWLTARTTSAVRDEARDADRRSDSKAAVNIVKTDTGDSRGQYAAARSSADVLEPGPGAAPARHSYNALGALAPRQLLKLGVRGLLRLRERFLLPDDEVLWLPAALWAAWRSHLRQPYDAILSTSGPYTNHLVALQLHRWTGLPWVADFRDPWTQNMHRPTDRWRLHIEASLEEQVARSCSCLTTVTQSFAEQFRTLYGEPSEAGPALRRLEVIYNGYDPADREGIEPIRVLDKLSFLYTGILYGKRSPASFLRGLRLCLDRNWVSGDDVVVQFAGVFDYPGHNDNRQLVETLGLQQQVELLGNVPHKEALARQAGAGVLLLIGDQAPDAGAYIPGKLFEYMAAGRPILALQREGEASRIIRDYQLGQVVAPDDSEGAARAIAMLYEQWVKESRKEKGSANGDGSERREGRDGRAAYRGGSLGEEAGRDGEAKQADTTKPESNSLLRFQRREQARQMAQLLFDIVDQ